MDVSQVSIPRPPAGITPRQFFEDWLPPILKEFMPVIQSNMGDLQLACGFQVAGEQSGEWSVKIGRGEVKLAPGLDPDAVLTLSLSTANFVEAVIGERDDLLPGLPWLKKGGWGDPVEIGRQIRNGAGYLGSMKGTLLFRAMDPSRPFQTLLKFQGETKDEPDVVISIDQEVLRRMARGESSILNAFMSGHIKISGAMHLLMSFASLVMR